MTTPASRVTLRTADADGLADPDVRRTVVAAAHALGERMGVAVLDVSVDPDALHAAVEGPPIVATGFAAELRRSTERWHVGRFGTRLWRSEA
jgi:putative aminopeptidase FrvX